MSICNEIQQKIVELALKQVIENQDEINHIESCQACQDYQQSCQEMNHAMSGLGNFDAEDALVESTLNSILSLQEENKKTKPLLNTQWASGLAASFMLVSLIALFPYNSISNFGRFSDTQKGLESVAIVSNEEKQKIKLRKEALSKKKQDNSGFEFIEVEVAQEVNRKQRRIPKKPAPPSSRDLNDQYRIGSQSSGVNLSVSPFQDDNSEMAVNSLGKIIQDEFKKDAQKELLKLATNQPYPKTSKPALQGQEKLDERQNHKANSEHTDEDLCCSQDDVKLDRITVTGSRIKRTILQEPLPVMSTHSLGGVGQDLKNEAKDKSQVVDSQANGRIEFKLRSSVSEDKPTYEVSPKAEEQDAYALMEDLVDGEKGVNLNSEGIGQALVYPYKQDKQKDTFISKDGLVESPRTMSFADRQAFEELSESEDGDVLMKGLVGGKHSGVKQNKNKNKNKNENENREFINQRQKQIRDNAIASKFKSKKPNFNRYDDNDEQSEGLVPIIATGRRVKIGDNKKFTVEKYTSTGLGAENYTGLFKHRYAKLINANGDSSILLAKNFLKEMNSLNNIKYQKATGYWANNYLPGDASMRLLAGNLLQNNADIKSIVEQNRQPFDYPSNSALAVYLSSDHANVNAQGPTRMRVQVGIQASNRKGGHRSAMNIGLVFDVTEYNTENTEKMKALLLAILKAKQVSDNISVILTGVNGGELIKTSEFRYGTIQTTMNRLTSGDAKQQGVALSLHQAINLASANLQKDDDPTASLGSSVVMLITDKSIDEISAIEATVHNNAVKGITFSTVSLAVDNHQLNQLALAGQGHARILQNANDAKRVVEAELLASSRAVARALRLRIRLAKGVKLIKVLDSYNLNEKQAQRVRDAENSLDQRLSKNLGIQTDRGEDEEGIQIVIPSFFAGDTHVVILDVVVNNPGAIADVSLRYKDLLYLRNAISRKQLNLSNDKKSVGPLQLNVIKNVLASRFSKDIKRASFVLKNGHIEYALSILLPLKKLYQSMRLEFPSWNNDAEIIKDEKLIQQYIELINQTIKSNAPQFNYIVDSLQYISWRKNITQSK